eukprot:766233-Hanusia_phi.AAC.1
MVASHILQVGQFTVAGTCQGVTLLNGSGGYHARARHACRTADVQCELRAICHDEELAFEKTSISTQVRPFVGFCLSCNACQRPGIPCGSNSSASPSRIRTTLRCSTQQLGSVSNVSCQLEITLWDTSCDENDDDSAFLGEVVLNVSKLVAYEV